MMKPQVLYVILSIFIVQVQAASGSASAPIDPYWRTAGLLVGTVHNERLDQEWDQWLPFDWTWNLIFEDDLLEDGFVQTQQRLDEFWAIVDASDNSTQPLPESLRNWYQEQLYYLDPDLDRKFDLSVWIRNGLEVIRVPKVVYEKGAMSWHFSHYDSVIEMTIKYYPLLGPTRLPSQSLELEGEWVKHRVDSVARLRFFSTDKGGIYTSMPENSLAPVLAVEPVFKTVRGISTESKWAMKLARSGEAVASFKWYGTASGPPYFGSVVRRPILATVQTPTGDFRYMSGYERSHFELCGNGYETDSNGRIVYPDSVLVFSCFDGAHAFLFTAVSSNNNSDAMHGDFWSGNWWHETWTAVRDDDAKLPDAFEQTVITDEEALDEMVFQDLEGVPTRVLEVLDESKAKARVIEIFGTWCPNCGDAGRELVSLKEMYGDDLAIVGLAFEITNDFERSVTQVKRHHEHIGSDWPILIAGLSDKDKASAALPVLDKVRSYPTLIFLNEKNEVAGVYSGFSGPATGDAYKEQRLRFEKLINGLIEE